MVHQLFHNDVKKIVNLFNGWNETLIWSCLQGYMGTAWVDDEFDVQSAQIVIADFCFFAGKAKVELVKNKPQEHKSDFIIMVPQNEEWAELIEKVYGENATKVTRYAIKKETEIFDAKKLRTIVQNLDKKYCLRIINEELFHSVRENDWSYDLCSQFKDFEEYQKNGIGVVILHSGELVSGASSYTVYRDGIEIEIDTRADYRRRGLALVCGARLILECMERNLYPSWDAQNQGSVALAEKLGYHFDYEYSAYEIHKF